MSQSQTKSYLQLPIPQLDRLSFCDANAKQLEAWVSALPMANLGETARQLYHAIIELNQVRLAPNKRFELTELFRGPIYYICSSLGNRYLMKSVVLDENQRKIANLAQALQMHLTAAYRLTLNQCVLSSGSKFRDLTARTLHRALSDISPNILRSYQLYLKTSAGIWQEIHHLYKTADSLGLTGYRLKDPMNTHKDALTVEELYIRILLLGTCQPNQLDQRELTEVFSALEIWAGYVALESRATEQSALAVSLSGDAGPVFRHLLKTESLPRYLGLNTQVLVRGLHASESDEPSGARAIHIPDGITPSLNQHLVQSWGGMKQRAFSRKPASGTVEVAVGLSSVHFQLSGEVPFQEQLAGKNTDTHDDAMFQFAAQASLKEQYDVWEESFDAGRPMNVMPPSATVDFSQEEETSAGWNKTVSFPKYQLSLVNTSPRGYCVSWDTLAENAQTGEIILIREMSSSKWNLGIIRWIRQSAQQGATMGLELIAPNAEPCGVRVLHKTGQHGDYMRGMILPEIRQIGQPVSVLVPRIPFQTGQKVGIKKKGSEQKFMLTRKAMGTSTLNQFYLRGAEPSQPEEKSEGQDTSGGFDTLWRQL